MLVGHRARGDSPGSRLTRTLVISMTADNVTVLEEMRVMLINQDRLRQDRAAFMEETRLAREHLQLERRAVAVERKSKLLSWSWRRWLTACRFIAGCSII